MSSEKKKKKALIDPKQLRELAAVHPLKNLGGLALDYLVLIASCTLALTFYLKSGEWGIHWAWQIPVWIFCICINGCLTHRIGLMGHEASHNLLVPNRKWNDILAEWLCFYPVYGSLVQYRAKHLNHHLHPNDPELDPNLGSGKAERLYAKFPMPRRSFIYTYYAKFFWPPFVFANLLDLFSVITLGSGMGPVPEKNERKGRRGLATLLGVIYLVGLVVALQVTNRMGGNIWITIGAVYFLGVAIWSFLPESFYRKSARIAISIRAAGLLRFTFYTVQYAGVAALGQYFGKDFTFAYLLLWVVPLIYFFPYLMLLREIYQHANAGTGILDNSRIIHADPFTRWAVLGYGNDFHLIHHIYPNIPHYQLRDAHDQLRDGSEEYRENAEENRGIFRGSDDEARPLIESLEQS